MVKRVCRWQTVNPFPAGEPRPEVRTETGVTEKPSSVSRLSVTWGFFRVKSGRERRGRVPGRSPELFAKLCFCGFILIVGAGERERVSDGKDATTGIKGTARGRQPRVHTVPARVSIFFVAYFTENAKNVNFMSPCRHIYHTVYNIYDSRVRGRCYGLEPALV